MGEGKTESSAWVDAAIGMEFNQDGVKYSISSMNDQTPAHGCGHMQGKGAA